MSPRWIRWLVPAALVLPLALLLSPVQAQMRGPGRPGGGIGGMPGGGRPGGGIGGMPGGGPLQTEWRCSKCNALLGTGPVKPNLASCPQCGAHFVNGGGFGPIEPPVMPPGGGAQPPATPPPAGGNPKQPANPNPPAAPPQNPNPPAAPPANNNNNFVPPAPANNQAAAADSGLSGRTVLIIVAVGGGALLLFAALGTFLYISVSRAAKENAPRRKRRRVYHDEDDD
jgi:hypothetical protein